MLKCNLFRILVLWTTLCLSTSVFADCFDSAATYQHVNSTVLRAIAVVESNNNPRAINRNKNGSTDIGLMQINTIHMPELNKVGIHKRDLMNACKNIYVAAWLLRKSIGRHGNIWLAAGGYHSETPSERLKYALKVRNVVLVMLEQKRHPWHNPVVQVYASN